jgi:hypothetical protein
VDFGCHAVVRGPSLSSGYHNTQFWKPTPLDPRTHPAYSGYPLACVVESCVFLRQRFYRCRSRFEIAVQYWRNQGRAEKCRIVALEHAYHGDTIGAMSVGADSAFTAAFEALRLPVLRVTNAEDLEEMFRRRMRSRP